MESSKLVVPVKSKSEKLRIESMMPSVLPELPLLKVSSLEEEVLSFMLLKVSKNWLATPNFLKAKLLVSKSFKTP